MLVAHGSDLTESDLKILRLLVQGRTTVTIARQLDLSERTVRRHVRTMGEKLGVGSTIEVVVAAVRHGLV